MHREADLISALRAGVTGMRLNLSHAPLCDCAEWIAALHSAAKKAGLPAKLLIDLTGPELRIGELAAPLRLSQGQIVLLGRDIPAPAFFLERLSPGSEIALDDGRLLFRVVSTDGHTAACRVLRAGLLFSKKSLSLLHEEFALPPLTPEDRKGLSTAGQMGVTGVMQPFVRCRADLEAVRAALKQNGAAHIQLFAKIETRSGVQALPTFIDVCDQVVIARGNLGNSLPLWELPALQKDIAALCRAQGKPFMIVTQLLHSMLQSPIPTRAEVLDIFNAVLDGAASLMLTGETAIGRHPLQAVEYLVKTARDALDYRQRHS